MANEKPGLLLQPEAVFLPFRSAYQDLLASGEGRFFPLQADAFQDEIRFFLDDMVQKQKADDAAYPQEKAHGEKDGVLLGQGINTSKQDTEKADCTDGSQPGK